jgi:hypothetical protein
MKLSFLYLICIMMCCNYTLAQNTFPKNAFYLEAGAGGGFGSINYERQLTKKPGIGVRIGAGFYTEDGFYFSTPVGINYLLPLKKENRFIDAGFNVTPFFKDARFNAVGDDKYVNFIPVVGYRVHNNKNWFWRASAAVVINRFAGTPWAGFALGKVF